MAPHSRLAMLKDICEEAWKIVATYVANDATGSDGSSNGEGQSAVAIFNEFILRDIVSLTSEQQTDLVRKVARGKNGKGHKFGKKDFKEEAERYRAYNTLVAAADAALGERRGRPKAGVIPQKVAEFQEDRTQRETRTQAAKTAGFGNHETGRQAKKVVSDGARLR